MDDRIKEIEGRPAAAAFRYVSRIGENCHWQYASGSPSAEDIAALEGVEPLYAADLLDEVARLRAENEALKERLSRLERAAMAFLRFFRLSDLAEDVSRQGQSVSEQCRRARALLGKQEAEDA